MKHPHVTLSFGRLFTGVTALAIIAGISAHSSQQSLAATNHAPTGSFTGNSCAYDSGRGDYLFTITAKWSDADAGSDPPNAYLGSNTSTGNYDGAGTASASNTLDGVSHNGPTYTWRLYRSTLSDAKWPVRLFVHDVGNPTSNTWKLVATIGKPACPAPPAPPAAAPPATSGGSTTKRTTTTGTKTTTAAPAAPAAPGSDANGAPTVGTTAASIVIPAEGASKLHIAYGLVNGPSVGTDDQPVSGDSTTVILTGLNAKADYNYQIIRINSSEVSSTSGAASFSTKGFGVQLLFTDAKKKPVSGVSGSINDQDNTAAKSDKNGKLTFSGLPDGSYTVAYSYKGHAYTKDFDTASDTSSGTNADGTPKTITLTGTVNVDKLGTASATKSGSGGHNTFLVILGILFVLGLVGGGAWYLVGLLRRRRLAEEYSSLETPGSNSDVLDRLPAQPAIGATSTAGAPLPSHAGESLRDMVLESMREQHQLPQQQPVTDPFVPVASPSPQPGPMPERDSEPMITEPVAPAATPIVPDQSASTPPSAPNPGDDSETIRIQH